MRSQISICNGALDELPAGTIQSIDDPDDVGARACKRRYDAVLEDLLAEHTYDASIRREVLAQTTNDRSGEWLYCYQEPTAARTILRILPNFTSAYTSAAYTILAGQRNWTGLGYYPDNVGTLYRRAAGKIYTNTEQAVCEYVSSEVELALFSPLFARAFELELAARICMPVLKDRARWKELIPMAETARQRAIAHDRNNSPERYDGFASEDAQARSGWSPSPGWYGSGIV